MATLDRKKREERLKKICEAINKAEKSDDVITYLGSGDSVKMERFPSGCMELDEALGGGWPRGRFIELYGPESAGKTTLCYHAIVEHQKKYPEEDVALVDTEFVFDEDYAKAIGVDTDFLLVHQPNSGEQALKVVRHLIHQNVGLVIVDSVAALTPQAELDGDIGDAHVGQQARLMSQTMRMLTGEAAQRNVTIFWTNQMRDKIGVMWGDKTTTPGGHALKHHASIRVGLVAISKEKDGDEIVGIKVQASVKKNKTAPPFRKAIFYVSFGTGIDSIAEVCDAAITRKIVSRRGAKIIFGNEIIANGRKDFLDCTRKDASLKTKLEEALRNAPPPEETFKEDVEAAQGSFKKPKNMGVKRIPVEDVEVLEGVDERASSEGGVEAQDV